MSATAPSTGSSAQVEFEKLVRDKWGGEDVIRGLLGKNHLGEAGIRALTKIAVATTKKAGTLSADKVVAIGNWINLCTKERMLQADLQEILSAINDDSEVDWLLIDRVSRRRGDNNVFSEEDDTIIKREVFSSWGHTEATKLMVEIDKGTKTQTIMFNTSFLKDLNKISDVHKKLSALSILKAIEVKNLDRDTIGRVIKDTEKFFSLKKEICDVFNSMKSKGLSPIGVRDAILDLAIDSTNGQPLKNLKAMIDALGSSVSLDKDEMKVIIDKLHKLGNTDITGRVQTVSTCIKIMKTNNVRLRSMRDINKLGKLMEMEEGPLKRMAGVLAAAEEHPLFKKHPNDFFDYIYDQRLQMGDAEITVEGKTALTGTFSKMSGVTLNRRGSFKPMVGCILKMTNVQLEGMDKLLGAVEGAQFIADPNDICACLSENLVKLYPDTGGEEARGKKFTQNVEAVVGCIKVMINKGIALVGTVRADKLKALMTLPHEQLRNAQKIMEALSVAGAFDRNPNDRFNILLKNIANITADPIRTDSLIVAIKLMKAKHWNGTMFDITNSVMSRLMELSPEKLWGFTERMGGEDWVGERTGGEVHELLREGRSPGAPAMAVCEFMRRLSDVETAVAAGKVEGTSEKEGLCKLWVKARTGAVGWGGDSERLLERLSSVTGGTEEVTDEAVVAGGEVAGVEQSEDDMSSEGSASELTDVEDEVGGCECAWDELLDLVERGPIEVDGREGESEEEVRAWVRRVWDAVEGNAAREWSQVEVCEWECTIGRMRRGRGIPDEAIAAVIGFSRGEGLAEEWEGDEDNGERRPGMGRGG